LTICCSVVSCVGNTINYDFTTALSQAFASNMVLVGGKASFYTGDVDANKFVNGLDVINVYNDNVNFVSGSYVNTDVDYNGFTNGIDIIKVYNNSIIFAKQIDPVGAVPLSITNNKVLKSDSKSEPTFDPGFKDIVRR
jgi:hypothetical protein